MNSSTRCLLVIPQDLDNTLEGKPLGDIFSSSKHLSELGSRQFSDFQVLGLGFFIGDVSLLCGVDQVQTGNGGDTQFFRVSSGSVLRVKCTIVVLSSDTGLGSSHITSDNEMCAAKVLSDDHMLDRLTWSSHVHRVWQVFPEDTWVGRFLLQNFVSLVANGSWNIIGLAGESKKIKVRKILNPKFEILNEQTIRSPE